MYKKLTTVPLMVDRGNKKEESKQIFYYLKVVTKCTKGRRGKFIGNVYHD